MINNRLYQDKIYNISVFILLLHIFDPSVILSNLAQYFILYSRKEQFVFARFSGLFLNVTNTDRYINTDVSDEPATTICRTDYGDFLLYRKSLQIYSRLSSPRERRHKFASKRGLP